MLQDADSLAAARDHVIGYLVDFVRTLRERGVRVPADGSLVAARAVAAVGLEDREQARIALRSALVSHEADLDRFDALFPAFWRQLCGEDDHHVLDPAPEMGTGAPTPGARPGLAGADPAAGDDTVGDTDGAGTPMVGGPHPGAETDATEAGSVYSPAGVRERVRAAPAEGDGMSSAVGRLVEALSGLPGRRWSRSGADRIDVRRALRRSVAGGGAALPLPYRDRRRDAVRVALLVDVSRSVLDTVERGVLLRFAAELRRTCRSSRIFFFDTDVREVTDAFGRDDAGAALERAEAEWGGGTRIGHALGQLRAETPAAVDHRTVTVVVSDGLEVGELGDLEAGMAWLSRRAGAVLWLNPLAASPEYEPATRGMERSLPYVDGLFAFAGGADIEEVARQLERRGLAGPIGYEYDPRRRD